MSVAATGRTTGSTLPEIDMRLPLLITGTISVARDPDISALATGAHARVDCGMTVSREARHQPDRASRANFPGTHP